MQFSTMSTDVDLRLETLYNPDVRKMLAMHRRKYVFSYFFLRWKVLVFLGLGVICLFGLASPWLLVSSLIMFVLAGFTLYEIWQDTLQWEIHIAREVQDNQSLTNEEMIEVLLEKKSLVMGSFDNLERGTYCHILLQRSREKYKEK